MRIVGIIILIGICAMGCEPLYKKMNWKPDNPIEEAGEAIAENYFGLPTGTLDVTPLSPE